MAAVQRVLIVGAGIGGLTLAIALRQRGIAAEVVEIEARVVGVGITLTGSTLRALDRVGLAAGCAERGFGFDFFLVSDGEGKLQATNPLPPSVPGLPAAVGLQRPVFADFMTKTAEAKGASIRSGLTVADLREDASGVDVTFHRRQQRPLRSCGRRRRRVLQHPQTGVRRSARADLCRTRRLSLHDRARPIDRSTPRLCRTEAQSRLHSAEQGRDVFVHDHELSAQHADRRKQDASHSERGAERLHGADRGRGARAHALCG